MNLVDRYQKNMSDVYLYEFHMINSSPLLIGTGKEGVESITRQGDRLLIPGTTMMGAYTDFLFKYGEDYPNAANYVKKMQRIENVGSESEDRKQNIIPRLTNPIVFYECVSTSPFDIENELVKRSRVAIDMDMGSAKKNHLSLNECAVQSGVEFRGLIELRFNKSFKSGVQEEDVENLKKELVCSMELFLKMLLMERIGLGKNGSLGYGRFNLSKALDNSNAIKLSRTALQLANREDFLNYLSFRPTMLGESVLENAAQSSFFKKIDLSDLEGDVKSEQSYRFKLKGRCEDGFIIKDQKPKDGDVLRGGKREKMAHSYNENGVYIIPSSSIKGIFRSYSRKILMSLADSKMISWKDEDVERFLSLLYGGMTNAGNTQADETAVRGIVQFKDVLLKEKNRDMMKTCVYSRVRIDRFTGGVTSVGPFKTETCITDNLEIEAIIECPTSSIGDVSHLLPKGVAMGRLANRNYSEVAEMGAFLLSLCFRDLAMGQFSIGGNRSVGFGFIEGKDLSLNLPGTGDVVQYVFAAETEHHQNSNWAFLQKINEWSTTLMSVAADNLGGEQ